MQRGCRGELHLIRLSTCFTLFATQSRAWRERSEFQNWAERVSGFKKVGEIAHQCH
jgi:hypothetical protein